MIGLGSESGFEHRLFASLALGSNSPVLSTEYNNPPPPRRHLLAATQRSQNIQDWILPVCHLHTGLSTKYAWPLVQEAGRKVLSKLLKYKAVFFIPWSLS